MENGFKLTSDEKIMMLMKIDQKYVFIWMVEERVMASF